MNQSGMSLISTMILAAMIVGSAVAISSLLVGSRTAELRTTRWGRGEQVVVNTAAQLQDKPYSTLLNYCKQKKAYQTVRNGICANPNGTLAAGPTVRPGTDPDTGQEKLVEVLRTWNGDPSPQGNVCVELTSCTERASGYILEVTLNGYWAEASSSASNVAIAPKMLVFRRTR